MKIVIALGGNAIGKGKENYKEIINKIKHTSKNIINLIKNNKVIITFGNGPQIGELLLQNEIASKYVHQMPLDFLGAETDGLIGYLLQEQITNELRKNKIKKNIAALITQTLVSKKDKAFRNPTKFIGQFYSEKEIKNLKFKVKKDSNRGYRRVVPSPEPIKIIENKIINKLANKNYLVICNGGGGIPVILQNKKLEGVEAVVDKDLSSSCLANEINADLFLILTDVNKVYLNYGSGKQIGLKKLNLEEAKKYLYQGQFPDGSMGPKIKAAINFLTNKKRKVIICNIENVEKALIGKEGTLIIR